MSNPTVDRVIREMQPRYNPPANLTQEARDERLLALAEDLAKYNEDMLAQIWEAFPLKYTKPIWPNISDFVKIAQAIDIKLTASEKRQLKHDNLKFDDHFATKMLNTDLAREAAEKGFVLSFYNWCAEHKTQPTPMDMISIERNSRLTRERMKAQVGENNNYAKKVLDGIEAKERRLAERVLGEVVSA